MDQPPSSVSIPSGGDPFEHLLGQVKEAAAGVYDVLGEIGRSRSGNVVYLARELETRSLLALKLTRTADGEFDLTVARTLEASVPGLENRCPECKETLPDWDRFCFHCGADLSGHNARPDDREADAIEEAVREATVGQYEIVGKMDRSDGAGLVFFARDLERNRLVALRLKRDQGAQDEESYSIGETQVLRPLASELAATQMAPHGLLRPPVPAQPLAPVPDAVPAVPSSPLPVEPVASGTRGLRGSRRLYQGAAGIAVLGILGVLLFGGDEEIDPEPTPADTPVVVTAATVDTATPPPAPAVAPPPAAAVPESGVVVLSGRSVTGIRFTVDGRPVRRWPLVLSAGPHTLVATAPGHDTVRNRLVVARAETTRWQPALTALPERVVNTAPPPASPAPSPAATASRTTCARTVARNDWAAALPLCRDEAADGNREAQRHYGEILAAGRGGAANPGEAATWFSKAATAGDTPSMVQLGLMYREGAGVRRDERQSVAWFRQAAEAGNAVGMMELGVMLDGGRGVDRNDAQAAQWFRRASDGGNAVATRRLGRLYERGEGVPRSENEAAALYRQAADKGDAEAQFQLGRFYKDGRGGLPKDNTAARDWFRRAAEQNHPAARDELRKMGGN